MDTHLFLEMLGIDSTSGKEGDFADMMAGRLSGPGRRVETFEVAISRFYDHHNLHSFSEI